MSNSTHADTQLPADPGRQTPHASATSAASDTGPPPDSPASETTISHPCPVCWRADAGCRVEGDVAACRHRKCGDCYATERRDGADFHLHQLPPGGAWRFVTALFEPADRVLLRYIRIWAERSPSTGREERRSKPAAGATHRRAEQVARVAGLWDIDAHVARQGWANQFFGVCPRFRTKDRGRSWDNAFQIRDVRCLWSDVDHCTPDEALARCAAAGLPRPTATVGSGNGAHLYWRLDRAYRIDDAGDPPGLQWEDVVADGVPVLREDGTPKRRSFYTDPEGGAKVYPPFALSPRAAHVEGLLRDIAARLGGDHTTDLARIMRLPSTWNRKGRKPTPCVLVECDPARRYPLSLFENLAEAERARSGDTDATARPPAPRARPTPPATGPTAARRTPGPADPSDGELLARMRRAANGGRFSALYDRGDLSAHGGDHSRADHALCRMIAFWCQDPDQIDRLFRNSALVRDKWEQRADYREATIRRALAGLTDTWGGPRGTDIPDVSWDQLRALGLLD